MGMTLDAVRGAIAEGTTNQSISADELRNIVSSANSEALQTHTGGSDVLREAWRSTVQARSSGAGTTSAESVVLTATIRWMESHPNQTPNANDIRDIMRHAHQRPSAS